MTTSSSALLQGGGASVLGGLLIVAGVTSFKAFRVGMVYELALINAALFAPAFAVALYYHIAAPKHAFDFRKLFTDSTRVQVGVFTMLYYLFTYCSYQLLPITLGVPLFMTFPLMIMALSPWVKGTAVPTWQESGCIGLIVLGLGGFFLHAATKTTGASTSLAVGLVLGVLGAVSMALRMLYTAQRPTAAPVRAAADVQRDDPEQTEAGVLSVQLLETSTIGLIGFGVLSVVLACVPASWLTWLTTRGVPAGLVDRRNSVTTLLVLFVAFVVCLGGGNLSYIYADNKLSPTVFAVGQYTTVLFSVLAGVFVLGESASVPKLVGLGLIIVGGALLVYLKTRPKKPRALQR